MINQILKTYVSYMRIDEDVKLISLDVVSLFTNVPVELTLDSVRQRWNYIETNCAIPCDDFIQAVKFVLDSTYFIFNGVCYRQTFGSPMGSPFSPTIADITLQDLETRAIGTLGFSLSFYRRYIDDIVTAVPSSKFNTVLRIFNSYHSRLQFTMEEETNNRLNFLDVTLIQMNNFIIFDWYHKPTFSGRCLHFESRHPLCQKRGTAIGTLMYTGMMGSARARFRSISTSRMFRIFLNSLELCSEIWTRNYPLPA
ncbi:uncharacterized protein [Temnothorax nylanderi]|uniref:uncharacterized protein n=1 Tax=Temnothorax nylanderi TaxID=102681 RepID=UPI003A870052